jgi:hypothetical protein
MAVLMGLRTGCKLLRNTHDNGRLPICNTQSFAKLRTGCLSCSAFFCCLWYVSVFLLQERAQLDAAHADALEAAAAQAGSRHDALRATLEAQIAAISNRLVKLAAQEAQRDKRRQELMHQVGQKCLRKIFPKLEQLVYSEGDSALTGFV